MGDGVNVIADAMREAREKDCRPLFDRLARHESHAKTVVFRDDNIRAHATECHDIGHNGMLAVMASDSLNVSFAVFELFAGSYSDGSPDEWQVVFYGSGPSGELRELRHTWWGNLDGEGYIFCPDAGLIAAAFAKLQTWFDCGG